MIIEYLICYNKINIVLKGIVNFKGLYGDQYLESFNDFFQYEPLKLRSKMYNWEIKSHVHSNLYQLFILTAGSGKIVNANEELTFKSPCLIHLPPNTLHGFKFNQDIDGHVISISDGYFESIFNSVPKLLLWYSELKLINLQAHSLKEIVDLLIKVNLERTDNKLETNVYLSSLFTLFFIEIARAVDQDYQEVQLKENRTLQYFNKFHKKAKANIGKNIAMEEFASDLGISLVHLNRICHSVAQKSSLQIVQELVIEEAKKFLNRTEYSISEIAYFLNYSDPAYFTRVFKKHTGKNPKQYRSQM